MKSILDKFDRFMQAHFGGHVHVAGVTIYGWNAMHCAINVYTKRWGYLCFHPTMYVFGRWWPWYAYVSRDATPTSASWGTGPGYGRCRMTRDPRIDPKPGDGNLVKIRFLKVWGHPTRFLIMGVGDTATVSPWIADTLVRQGVAEVFHAAE